MKFFLDTEFTDFIASELISIGIVSEDGQHGWYIEISDYNRSITSGFVKNVVEPLLNHALFGMQYIEASARFGSWLEEIGGEDHQIVVDYQTDWDLYVKLLDYNLPKNFSRQPILLYDELSKLSLNYCIENPQPDVSWFMNQTKKVYNKELLAYFDDNNLKQHHAFNDAKAIRHAWIETNKLFLK